MLRKVAYAIICCAIWIPSSTLAYSRLITVKHPFLSEHCDTTGQSISDSLARWYRLVITIVSVGGESLSSDAMTGDDGCAIASFDLWPDSTPVSESSITRMAIAFPETNEATGSLGQCSFHSLEYDSVDFTEYSIEMVLPPLTVSVDRFTIGDPSGFNVCNMAVLNDMHIGEDNSHQHDFEGGGWNDHDYNSESGSCIENSTCVLDYLRNRGTLPIFHTDSWHIQR